jgi:hypothetical protein
VKTRWSYTRFFLVIFMKYFVRNKDIFVIILFDKKKLKCIGCFLLSWHCSFTKQRGWYCVFFNNSSWSSNFYFVWFDPNWKLIASEFLVDGEIERRIKMKMVSNMGGMLEIAWKIHLDFLSLKLTQCIQFRFS